MKVADLMEDLESGDRTSDHLVEKKPKPQVMDEAGVFPEFPGVFNMADVQRLANMMAQRDVARMKNEMEEAQAIQAHIRQHEDLMNRAARSQERNVWAAVKEMPVRRGFRGLFS